MADTGDGSDGGSPIRVLLVDDHGVVRRGLRGYLELLDDIEVVGEAENGVQAVEIVDQLLPDVVLMDIVMPGASGIEVTPAVLKEHPAARVLVLSMQDDPTYVREAFAAGASGYVLKEAADQEVVGAIRDVVENNQPSDVLRILREEGAPDIVVFHAFSGDAQMARECVTAGYYLSLPGVVQISVPIIGLVGWIAARELVRARADGAQR
jgi:CheY-like chemotaxis protein